MEESEGSLTVDIDSPITPSSPNEDSNFNWHSDDEEGIEDGKKGWFRRASLLTKWIILTLAGLIFFVTPTILWDYYFRPNDILERGTHRTFITEIFRTLVFLSTSWMTVVISYAVIRILPHVVLRFSENFLQGASERTKTRIEQYFALRKYVTTSLSFLVIALAAAHIFPGSKEDSELSEFEEYFKAFLWSLCIASTLLTLQKCFANYLAAHFHSTAYDERIRKNKFAIRALDCLNQAAKLGESYTHEEIENDKRKFDINSTAIARRKAQAIFLGLSRNGKKPFIEEKDFRPYFDNDEDCRKAFDLFDKDKNGDVSKREMKVMMVEIYRERRELVKALNNLDQVVGKVDKSISVVTALLSLFFGCLLLGVPIDSILVPFGSMMVALTFVFGQTARETFESLVFLFVTHPYDTGDRVIVGDTNMVVREIGVLSTIFETTEGTTVYIPNSILKSSQIRNIRRSTGMGEKIEVHVDFFTPMTKLKTLQQRLGQFLDSHPREFSGKMDVQLSEVYENNRLTLSLWLQHKSNWQVPSERYMRRNKFMIYLKEVMEDLKITYTPLVQTISVLNPPPYCSGQAITTF